MAIQKATYDGHLPALYIRGGALRTGQVFLEFESTVQGSKVRYQPWMKLDRTPVSRCWCNGRATLLPYNSTRRTVSSLAS